jgi:alcohol dehydrogenase class IV
MGCCHHHYDPVDGGAEAFTVEMPRVTFGRGTLAEVGARVRARGWRRVALITDGWLAGAAHYAAARDSLEAAGVQYAEFNEVHVEPTDRSVKDCEAFLNTADFDGIVTVGGGSVMDTAKAAAVHHAWPADATAYFAPPAGDGQAVPGPVLPHIACPTTAGTGSEMTGLAVIRLTHLDTKFVIASRHIMPVEAIIDPAAMDTLAPAVVASSGFDCMSHAIECYTARAYTRWGKVAEPMARPVIQGANPWSDLGALEALRLTGRYLERAVADAADHEARDGMMWAAALAGMAFGNAGTHLPHAMSYGLTNLVRDYKAPDYRESAREGPFLPHGISVVVNAPSVFRWTAEAAPERHLEAAAALGAQAADATPADAGEVTAKRIIALMRGTGIPNGLRGVGFGAGDAGALADSAARQGRAVGNAPRDCARDDLEAIYAAALSYW